MTQPAMETFQYTEPENYIVRVGTGTGTVGMLHQVKSVSGSTTADYPKQSVRRLGDSAATTIRGTPEYNSTCAIEFYDEADVEDWLALTGQAGPTGGVSLDVTDTVTIQVELYVSGTLTKWHKLTSAWVESDSFTMDADTSPIMGSINLVSDAKWTTYTAS